MWFHFEMCVMGESPRNVIWNQVVWYCTVPYLGCILLSNRISLWKSNNWCHIRNVFNFIFFFFYVFWCWIHRPSSNYHLTLTLIETSLSNSHSKLRNVCSVRWCLEAARGGRTVRCWRQAAVTPAAAQAACTAPAGRAAATRAGSPTRVCRPGTPSPTARTVSARSIPRPRSPVSKTVGHSWNTDNGFHGRHGFAGIKVLLELETLTEVLFLIRKGN